MFKLVAVTIETKGWAWPRSAKQGQLGNRIDSKSGNAVQFAKQAIRVEIVGDWKRLNPQ